MQPEQMYPSPVYDDPNAQQQKQRKVIGIIIALGVVLVIVAALVALLGGSGGQSQQLGLVSARQSEVIRLVDEYGSNASSAQTKNLVARTSVIFKSDLKTLADAGVAPTAEQATAAAIAGIDEVMQDAARSNRFDQTITEYIEMVITENMPIIEEAQKKAESQQLKEALEGVADNYRNLL